MGFIYEKKIDCPVCSSIVKTISIPSDISLNTFLQSLCNTSNNNNNNIPSLRLSKPSAVSSSGKTLYMPNPPSLEKATRKNLDCKLIDLLKIHNNKNENNNENENGVVDVDDEIIITDDILGYASLTIKVVFI